MSLAPPTTYLSAGISKVQIDDGSMCWSMESHKYVKAAMETIRTLRQEDGQELKGGQEGMRHAGPLPSSY